MVRRILGMVALTALCVTTDAAHAADAISIRIDGARAFYQKGDLPRTVQELEQALTELQGRLGKSFAAAMPPVPNGWSAEAPEVQGLSAVGGGLSVTRAYTGINSSLNASLIIDSPAVDAAAALLTNPAATAAQPNMSRIKIGAEEALMRWDGSIHSGEITMVLGKRILLEIQGDNLNNSDQLIEAAKGWNLAGIKKTAGI